MRYMASSTLRHPLINAKSALAWCYSSCWGSHSAQMWVHSTKPSSHLPAMVSAMVLAKVSTVLSATGWQAALCLRWYCKGLAKLNFPGAVSGIMIAPMRYAMHFARVQTCCSTAQRHRRHIVGKWKPGLNLSLWQLSGTVFPSSIRGPSPISCWYSYTKPGQYDYCSYDVSCGIWEN